MNLWALINLLHDIIYIFGLILLCLDNTSFHFLFRVKNKDSNILLLYNKELINSKNAGIYFQINAI